MQQSQKRMDPKEAPLRPSPQDLSAAPSPTSPAAWPTPEDGPSKVPLSTHLHYLKIDIENGLKRRGVEVDRLRAIAKDERKHLNALNNGLFLRRQELDKQLADLSKKCDAGPLKNYLEVQRALESAKRNAEKFEKQFLSMMDRIKLAFDVLEEKDAILNEIDVSVGELSALKNEGLKLFGLCPDSIISDGGQSEEFIKLSDEQKFLIFPVPPTVSRSTQDEDQSTQMYQRPPHSFPQPISPREAMMNPDQNQHYRSPHQQRSPLQLYSQPMAMMNPGLHQQQQILEHRRGPQLPSLPVGTVFPVPLVVLPNSTEPRLTVPFPFGTPGSPMSPKEKLDRHRVLVPQHMVGMMEFQKQCDVPVTDLPPNLQDGALQFYHSQGRSQEPHSLPYGDWSPAPQNIVERRQLQQLEQQVISALQNLVGMDTGPTDDVDDGLGGEAQERKAE